jgi:outer membrane protein TolC
MNNQLDKTNAQFDKVVHAPPSGGVSLRLNREGDREGEISVLQVLDAERSYEQALLGQIRARTAQCFDTTRLFVALGGNSAGAFQQGAELRDEPQEGSK